MLAGSSEADLRFVELQPLGEDPEELNRIQQHVDNKQVAHETRRKRRKLLLICQRTGLCCVLLLIIIWTIYTNSCWTSDDEYRLYKKLRLRKLEPVPLARAHSHNDYLQHTPLREALEEGFCSLEADVHLDNNELFLGHTEISLERTTLNDIYLKPLADLAVTSGQTLSAIHRRSISLSISSCYQITLLVDLKYLIDIQYVKRTWDELENQVKFLNKEAGANVFECYNNSYGKLFQQKSEIPGKLSPVKVVVSGIGEGDIEDFAQYMMQKEYRCSTLDGRNINLPVELASVQSQISNKWTEHFSSLSQQELHDYVHKAHERNWRVRFWDTPNDLKLWQRLVSLDVDLIGTDELTLLRGFFVGVNASQP